MLQDQPSLMTRIAVGKGLGFLVGLAGLVTFPYFMADVGWLVRIGILLWYTTLVGGWMNFVLTFFAYDFMEAILIILFGYGSPLASPWWFAAEGAVVGFVIGGAATLLGGEGKASVDA